MIKTQFLHYVTHAQLIIVDIWKNHSLSISDVPKTIKPEPGQSNKHTYVVQVFCEVKQGS